MFVCWITLKWKRSEVLSNLVNWPTILHAHFLSFRSHNLVQFSAYNMQYMSRLNYHHQMSGLYAYCECKSSSTAKWLLVLWKVLCLLVLWLMLFTAVFKNNDIGTNILHWKCQGWLQRQITPETWNNVMDWDEMAWELNSTNLQTGDTPGISSWKKGFYYIFYLNTVVLPKKNNIKWFFVMTKVPFFSKFSSQSKGTDTKEPLL